MKISTLFTVMAGLSLLQGCAMLDMPFSSHQTAVVDEGTYDDEYMSSPNQTPVRRSDNEDEVPVQMTRKDTQLHTLGPEAKPTSQATSQSNKNVMLPISSGLE